MDTSQTAIPQQLRWQGAGRRVTRSRAETRQATHQRKEGRGRVETDENELTTHMSRRILSLDFNMPIESQLDIKQGRKARNEIQFRRLDYSLNMDNSLRKKRRACERPVMCEATDQSNGVTITCQAGIYELLRRATLVYFSEYHNEGHSINMELGRDNEGNHVQAVMKLAYFPSGYNCYSITMYHTTSTIQINGKGSKKFFDKDWPKILRVIEEINHICKNTDPGTLNDNMRSLLQEATQVLKTRTRSTRSKNETSRDVPSVELGDDVTTRNQTNEIINTTTKGIGWPHTQKIDRLCSPTEEMNHSEGRASEGHYEPAQNLNLDPGNMSYRLCGTTAEAVTEPDPLHGTEDAPNPAESTPITAESTPITTTGQHQNTDWPVPDAITEPCRNCHEARTLMAAMEEERLTAQRRIRIQEKALSQREKDLSVKASQHASAKLHITALENQVKQLQETNRLLHDRLAAAEYPRSPVSTEKITHASDPQLEQRITSIERQLQDLRLKDIEAKLERISQNTGQEEDHRHSTGNTPCNSQQQNYGYQQQHWAAPGIFPHYPHPWFQLPVQTQFHTQSMPTNIHHPRANMYRGYNLHKQAKNQPQQRREDTPENRPTSEAQQYKDEHKSPRRQNNHNEDSTSGRSPLAERRRNVLEDCMIGATQTTNHNMHSGARCDVSHARQLE